MTRKELFFKVLSETKIIAVIRIATESDMVSVMKALYDGGVKIIEITSTSPNFLETIQLLKKQFGSSEDIFVGAGTVLDTGMAQEVINRGVDFVVSPIFDKDTVQLCRGKGISVMPGCMTPTEIYTAWKAGADVIKTFPGGICTPAFYRDMAGPFPQIRMMPTGNVNTQTAPEYIKAGAIAVGVGKALVSNELVKERAFAKITENARQYISLLKDTI